MHGYFLRDTRQLGRREEGGSSHMGILDVTWTIQSMFLHSVQEFEFVF